MKIAIIGGGAAGFFAAIQLKEQSRELQVDLFEKHNQYLSKVRISGGGRCNVTHHCFDPRHLIEAYPRGQKSLLRGFYHFGPSQMIEWLEERGVKLKTEQDGRMFPITDTSSTIIDLFIKLSQDLGVSIHTNSPVIAIEKKESGFEIEMGSQTPLLYDCVFLATGSSSQGYQMATHLGHTLIEPVPSLFTFVVDDENLRALSGISFKEAEIKLNGTKFKSIGPLLITHWGLSGPAILKLSSYAARELKEMNYKGQITIDLVGESSQEELYLELMNQRERHPFRTVGMDAALFGLTSRFWRYFLGEKIADQKWGKVDKEQLRKISTKLKQWNLEINGKSTYKEEFVTAGGVDIEEVDLCSFESRIVPNLYFIGEILNIDAITGGYNFQNAWTSAFLAARNVVKKSTAKT